MQLYYLTATHPPSFSTSEDFYSLLTEFLRPLPVPIFSTLVNTSYLDPGPLACLLQMLLRPLLAVSTLRYEIPFPTRTDLERYFLPHAAAGSSVADNAKVSVVLEALLRGLIDRGKQVGSAVTPTDGTATVASKAGAKPTARTGAGAKTETKTETRTGTRTAGKPGTSAEAGDTTAAGSDAVHGDGDGTDNLIAVVRTGILARGHRARVDLSSVLAASGSNSADGGKRGFPSGRPGSDTGNPTGRRAKAGDTESDRESLVLSSERLLLLAAMLR